MYTCIQGTSAFPCVPMHKCNTDIDWRTCLTFISHVRVSVTTVKLSSRCLKQLAKKEIINFCEVRINIVKFGQTQILNLWQSLIHRHARKTYFGIVILYLDASLPLNPVHTNFHTDPNSGTNNTQSLTAVIKQLNIDQQLLMWRTGVLAGSIIITWINPTHAWICKYCLLGIFTLNTCMYACTSMCIHVSVCMHEDAEARAVL